MSKRQLGNWLPKAVKALGNDTGLHHAIVLHDDWCDLLSGRGECNCSPTVEVITHEELQRRQLRAN